ncbi:MAG TPA: lactonase family protein [Bryobacteraceae bacterium]|nr:lactonase family protein [Bryobacteraceae bacterium]
MRRFLALTLLCAFFLTGNIAVGANFLMYVGTYTNEGSKGIYAWRFDSSTGKFTSLGLAAETPNPSFLAAHPNGKFLYAVNEISHFQRMSNTGSVSAFAIDPTTGKLRLLNAQGSQGDGPCHLALDHEGKCVIVANYNNGSVAAYPITPEGLVTQPVAFFQPKGSGKIPHRQDGPHAHCIAVAPDDHFALVADLGADQVMFYHLDPATAAMSANEPRAIQVAPGSGPRHLAFHPNGKVVYLINEMGSTIITFSYDAKAGSLSELQTVSTLPADFKGENDTAEIRVHPSGKFVYGSNRGHNSIAVFAVDSKTGTLKMIETVPTQGKTPRGFNIDPTGNFLIAANQGSKSIVEFRIDQSTGRLKPTGEVLQAFTPVDITFVPVK